MTRFEQLKEVKRYFNRRMRLATVQRALDTHLGNIRALLPAERSKFHPSQTAKYHYFIAVINFNMDRIDELLQVPQNPVYNVY